MGVFDFFRKGKEEKVEPKQPARHQQQDKKGTGSIVDLNAKQPQDRQPLQNQPAAQSQPAAIAPEYYEIKKGDSLSAIAKQRYGDATKWRIIYEANKDVIKNPDMIHPGQKIKIPSKQ